MRSEDFVVRVTPPHYLELSAKDVIDLIKYETDLVYTDKIDSEGSVYINFKSDDEMIKFMYHCVSLHFERSEINFSEFIIDFQQFQLNHIYHSEITSIMDNRIECLENENNELEERLLNLELAFDALQVDMYKCGLDRFREIMGIMISQMEEHGIHVREDVNNVCRHSLQ